MVCEETHCALIQFYPLQPGHENVEEKVEDEEQGFILLSAHLFPISMKCCLGAKSPSDDRM
jgi:hypothetical protein